jgi:hypothetical protein
MRQVKVDLMCPLLIFEDIKMSKNMFEFKGVLE